MAENVNIIDASNSAVTIAADQVVDATLGTAQVQFIKQMDGTIGSTNKHIVDPDGAAVMSIAGGKDIFRQILGELRVIRAALVKMACDDGRANPTDFIQETYPIDAESSGLFE